MYSSLLRFLEDLVRHADTAKALGKNNQLVFNRPIDERNQFFVVEVIRNIAEYTVYSEKIGSGQFMDLFIERNIMHTLD
jgi:hypothetical protein